MGDPMGKHLMVVYGDSHTIMWVPAYEDIAKRYHWRLVVFVKYFCPASLITVVDPPGGGHIGGPYRSCTQWHRWVVKTTAKLHADLVVVSQDNLYKTPALPGAPSYFFSKSAWQNGLAQLLRQLRLGGAWTVVLGNIPMLSQSPPDCLARNPGDVQSCSIERRTLGVGFDVAEMRAATETGSTYVNPTSWFCSSVCTAVVDHYTVYLDVFHVTGVYAVFLENVLANSLGFDG